MKVEWKNYPDQKPTKEGGLYLLWDGHQINIGCWTNKLNGMFSRLPGFGSYNRPVLSTSEKYWYVITKWAEIEINIPEG